LLALVDDRTLLDEHAFEESMEEFAMDDDNNDDGDVVEAILA